MLKSFARSAALGVGAAAFGLVALVAAAFALYFLLRDPLTPAGAAGVTAAVFLLLAGLVALAMKGGGSDKHHHAQPAHGGGGGLDTGALKDRAIAFAKERPLIAGGVGLLGALYVLRNPALVTGIIGLLAGRAEGKQEVRRGWF